MQDKRIPDLRGPMAALAVVALCLTLITGCGAGKAVDEPLVDLSSDVIEPGAVHTGDAPVTDRTFQIVAVAQNLYTFWNSGDTTFLDRAVDGTFVDNTLPSGRPQGIDGPKAASEAFRTAIPDLTCELVDLYLTGDTFTARLIFRGHFTGNYDGTPGHGQPIEFGALDIQHVGDDRIVEDWHLEDNLAFLQQADLISNQ